jgi:sterol-4alpha-carboxylate 3-dehydrogenase (decarboxylating)
LTLVFVVDISQTVSKLASWNIKFSEGMAETINDNFRVLITGGTGFLGRSLALQLANKYPRWKIDALDLLYPDDSLNQRLDKFMHADIRYKESVDAAFSNYHPDLVVHTAGIVPVRQFRYSTKEEDWERVRCVNLDGTKNVLHATMASGCTRFIYTSSVTAIIDDLDHDYHNMDESTQTGLATLHYGRSKGLAEAFVLSPSQKKASKLVLSGLAQSSAQTIRKSSVSSTT